MQDLLNKVGVINLKYDLIEDESKFNIFSILRNSSDEVNLHSRFIYELLSPNGSHNKKELFLESFLEVMEINDFNIDEVIITRERWKIDILIRNNKKQAIIIENKIWADDQQEQFYRYYHKIKEKGYEDIRMYYLTPHGHEPSDNSLGKLSDGLKADALFCKSYEYDIVKWMDVCIGQCALHPSLRETLVQYKKLVNSLTGNSTIKSMQDDIVNLLKKGDNIINAQKIAANWAHVNWTTEWSFWEALEKKIGEYYPVLNISKYSNGSMHSVYYKSRNRFSDYGVLGEICKIEGFSICLYFERGWENLYYGITITKDGERNTQFKILYPELSKEISKLSDEDNESWLGYSILEPKINFTSFNTEETMKLLNDNYRKKTINQIWENVTVYLEDVKKVMNTVK